MEGIGTDSNGLAPLGVVFLLVMGTLTVALPKKWAMVPLLATVCYIPLGQQLIVAGLHFPMLRLLILAGFTRIIVRREKVGLSWNKMDKLFVWWAVLSLILGTLAEPSGSILVNRLGQFFNSLGVFLLASCWVRDTKTLIGLMKVLAWMVLPVAVLMVVEKFTSHNVFSVFGGVPAITVEREGHLRCQAAFRHAILAGTFGASLVPIFVGLWFQEGARKTAMVGICSAVTIALASASSGPLMALLTGGIGFAMWRIRWRMQAVRRTALALIIVLALVMQAPVWYLFARLSSVTGGTGWHRAWLIDTTLAHVKDWFLFGTTYTAHWGGPGTILDDDPNNIDITNQFVLEAVRGGIVKLILFTWIVVEAFRIVGRAVRARADDPTSEVGLFFWALGVSLFTHCLSFLSVTYFDQMGVVWCWFLAVLSRVLLDPVHEQALVEAENAGHFEAGFSGGSAIPQDQG